MTALLYIDILTSYVHSSFVLPWCQAKCGTTFEALHLSTRLHQVELRTFMDHHRGSLF